jgi:hypothetical protein
MALTQRRKGPIGRKGQGKSVCRVMAQLLESFPSLTSLPSFLRQMAGLTTDQLHAAAGSVGVSANTLIDCHARCDVLFEK